MEYNPARFFSTIVVICAVIILGRVNNAAPPHDGFFLVRLICSWFFFWMTVDWYASEKYQGRK